MAKSIFPTEMLGASSNSEMTLESIAGKVTSMKEQAQLLHWRTQIYAEHQATGKLYELLEDFKDDVMEKLMGYMNGQRPKSFRIESPVEGVSAMQVAMDVCDFASSLKSWSDSKGYMDIGNIADSLSGEAAKIKYLLTLS